MPTILLTFRYFVELEPKLLILEELAKSIAYMKTSREKSLAWRDLRADIFNTVGWGRKSKKPDILNTCEAWDICLPHLYDLAWY